MTQTKTPNSQRKTGYAVLDAHMLEVWPHMSQQQMRILPILLSYSPMIFASQGVLAERCGKSRKFVNEVLGQLQVAGLLSSTRRKRKGGSFGTCLYQLADLSNPEVRHAIIESLTQQQHGTPTGAIAKSGGSETPGVTRSVPPRGVTAACNLPRGLQLKNTAEKKKIRDMTPSGVDAVSSSLRPSAATPVEDSSATGLVAQDSGDLLHPSGSTDSAGDQGIDESSPALQTEPLFHMQSPLHTDTGNPTQLNDTGNSLQTQIDQIYEEHNAQIRSSRSREDRQQLTQQKHTAVCQFVGQRLGIIADLNPLFLKLLRDKGGMISYELYSAAASVISHRRQTREDIERWIQKAQAKCTSEMGAGGLLFDMIMQNDPATAQDVYPKTCEKIRKALNEVGIGLGNAGKKFKRAIDNFIEEYAESLYIGQMACEENLAGLFRELLERGHTSPKTGLNSPLSNTGPLDPSDPDAEKQGGLRFATIREHMPEILQAWESEDRYGELKTAIEKREHVPERSGQFRFRAGASLPCPAAEPLPTVDVRPLVGNRVDGAPAPRQLSLVKQEVPATASAYTDGGGEAGSSAAPASPLVPPVQPVPLTATPDTTSTAAANPDQSPEYLEALDKLRQLKARIQSQSIHVHSEPVVQTPLPNTSGAHREPTKSTAGVDESAECATEASLVGGQAGIGSVEHELMATAA